ncbi:MAG: alpha-glucosidase [Lachnospiraceae bacterium]|nr:alpha-glucosidase [Lachnospiraceae bacterium]
MIRRFTSGKPTVTGAVIRRLPAENTDRFPFAHRFESGCFVFSFPLRKDEIVYGLGEAPRGINKRGWLYRSWCSDDPFHTENKQALYGAHNFLIAGGCGIFIDFPAEIRWDLGYTHADEAVIRLDGEDFDIYLIRGETPRKIVREFRALIGKSYLPPFWGLGYQQSRWSYPNAEAVRNVIRGYEEAGIPLDAVCLDIDYMERYKSFTVSEEAFPDFESFVGEIKAQDLHLVPIIDAGVKKEDGYGVYEEGREKRYFCKNADGSDFEGGVWPGLVGFPDFLRPEVRKWFGEKYRFLTDKGIDGFWNDMNEPAIFYSAAGLKNAMEKAASFNGQELDLSKFFELKDVFARLDNNPDDYAAIRHELDGKLIEHPRVHNLYGASMTRAAGEFFEKEFGPEKILLYSRASCVGAHRYGGIWFGDNASWWSHILLCLKMLPSVNMCGFLYCGADLGGFNDNVTRDLLLRFLALGVFTPLMRNHSALGTRDQECYRFDQPEDFRDIIQVRYRLIPYLYGTLRRAADENDMMFRPLSFDYPDDPIARECETQLMLGEELMIAPVYEQNASGRAVYLPEDMCFIKLSGERVVSKEVLPRGLHYVPVALNEVPLFLKKGKSIPLCRPALRTAQLDTEKTELLSW